MAVCLMCTWLSVSTPSHPLHLLEHKCGDFPVSANLQLGVVTLSRKWCSQLWEGSPQIQNDCFCHCYRDRVYLLEENNSCSTANGKSDSYLQVIMKRQHCTCSKQLFSGKKAHANLSFTLCLRTDRVKALNICAEQLPCQIVVWYKMHALLHATHFRCT